MSNYLGEPASPTDSSASSPSSQPEDLPDEPLIQSQTWKSTLSGALGGAFGVGGGAPGKRRAPVGPSMRDPKSRRKEEAGPRRQGGSGWLGDGKKGDKEELLDVQLAEKLKKDFGDPFDETLLKSSN